MIYNSSMRGYVFYCLRHYGTFACWRSKFELAVSLPDRSIVLTANNPQSFIDWLPKEVFRCKCKTVVGKATIGNCISTVVSLECKQEAISFWHFLNWWNWKGVAFQRQGSTYTLYSQWGFGRSETKNKLPGSIGTVRLPYMGLEELACCYFFKSRGPNWTFNQDYEVEESKLRF
jgi:hypothetical protein